MDAALTLDEANRRSDARYLIDMPQVLIEAGAHCEYVQIINVARMGFLAKSRCFYRTDEPILVVFPRIGAMESTIIWCANNMLGAKFVHPLELSALTRAQQGNGAVTLEQI